MKPLKYRVNMIRSVREMERRQEQRRVRAVTLSGVAIGLAALAVFYAVLQCLSMSNIIDARKQRLADIQRRYRRYTEAEQIVGKEDIELLDKLHGGKIFWTGVLAALARHLPEGYWTTQLRYDGKTLQVRGEGFAGANQDQLLVIDEYLNKLREDRRFGAVFSKVNLGATGRTGKSSRGRDLVTFQFTAERG